MVAAVGARAYPHEHVGPGTVGAVPDWLHSDNLRDGAVVALVLLVIAAVGVLRVFQKMVTRVVLLGVIAGLAAFVWFSRVELGDCAETCECRLLGQDIEVPTCRQKGTFTAPADDAPGPG